MVTRERVNPTGKREHRTPGPAGVLESHAMCSLGSQPPQGTEKKAEGRHTGRQTRSWEILLLSSLSTTTGQLPLSVVIWINWRRWRRDGQAGVAVGVY